ncbi:MAG TPA: hypothetical protein VL381_05250 [Rhodocyclaceae bacterium]|jgi:hypothetical protein|nr:hypothetical protein [Rhodocyclaceae bacterium]
MQRCLLFFAVILSACATPEAGDQNKLSGELASYVSDDMAVAEALATLSALGFACKDGAKREPPQANDFECTRKKGPRWEPLACLQTVRFKATDRRRVTNFEVLEPVCGK